LFILYLSGRFGPSLITEFHNDPDASNLVGLQALLITTNGYDVTSAQVVKDWLIALAVGGEITNGAVVNGLPVGALEMPFISQSKIYWTTPQAYSSPGAPNNGADFVRLRDAQGMYIAASEILNLAFVGNPFYPVNPVEWILEEAEPSVLYSGSGDSLDRSIARLLEIPTNGVVSLYLSYEIEEDYETMKPLARGTRWEIL
jgi:hypothetical protein